MELLFILLILKVDLLLYFNMLDMRDPVWVNFQQGNKTDKNNIMINNLKTSCNCSSDINRNMASSPIQSFKFRLGRYYSPTPSPQPPKPKRASLTVDYLENRKSVPHKVQLQEQACVFW